MSNLPSNLIKEFVKITNDSKPEKKQTQFYGTASVEADGIYVRLDGSEILTPVSMATDAQTGDRVLVEIVNHSARIIQTIDKSASDNVADRIQNDETGVFKELRVSKEYVDELVASDITADSIVADRGKIEDLKTDNLEVKEKLTANEADIKDLQTDNVYIEEKLTANEADIKDLQADNAYIEEKLTVNEASIKDLEAENVEITGKLDANEADIEDLKTDNLEIKEKLTANEADIKDLQTDKLDAEIAKVTYAEIDFSNIGKAAMEYFYATSGLIKDVTVGDQTITGHLVGVTISGDLIEGNTIKAEKLVVKGEDGLYYKLNIEGGSTTTEEITKEDLQNGLDGRNIIAKTITATQISVSDLVAFDATIGGFKISDTGLHSIVKESVDNAARGAYLDNKGQFNFGDSDNYLMGYIDPETDEYRIALKAHDIILSGTNISINTEMEDLRSEIKTMKDEVTCNLRIESSRGTVFKNNAVSTVLSAVIYRGSMRITDMTTLKSIMGSSAYLQWSWQRLDETNYGIISADDSRIGNGGFTFTLTPEDVDTKVTFMCELIT